MNYFGYDYYEQSQDKCLKCKSDNLILTYDWDLQEGENDSEIINRLTCRDCGYQWLQDE